MFSVRMRYLNLRGLVERFDKRPVICLKGVVLVNRFSIQRAPHFTKTEGKISQKGLIAT